MHDTKIAAKTAKLNCTLTSTTTTKTTDSKGQEDSATNTGLPKKNIKDG